MNAGDSQAAAPLSREIALQAAEWFVLLHSGEASEADHRAFEAWRTRADVHEQAWLRALAVSQRAGSLPPALGAPALGRKQRRLGAVGRRDTVRALALLITAAPVGWLAWRAAPWMQWTSTHATATGERREWTLADGSRLVLDTASAMDVRFDDQLRRVHLNEGAVFIETAPDPQTPPRPFVVTTGQGRVRAIGTRFVVRGVRERSEVAVLQGAVQITTRGGAAQQLQAGQQLWFDAMGMGRAEPADAGAAQWARGLLSADNMRLADFVAELSRYRSGWLHCDPSVADLRVTGAFQLGDADTGTDAVLANLVHLLPVQVHYRTRYWVTVAARGTPPT